MTAPQTDRERIDRLEGEVLALKHFVRALLSNPDTSALRVGASQLVNEAAKALDPAVAQSATTSAHWLFQSPVRR